MNPIANGYSGLGLKLLPGHVCFVNLLTCFIFLDHKHIVLDHSFGALICSQKPDNMFICCSK